MALPVIQPKIRNVEMNERKVNEILDLPEHFLAHCQRLFDHQMWAIGVDIKHPDSNLLLDFGFTKFFAEDTDCGKMTQYECIDQHLHVKLWGFGAYFGDKETGIFLPRKDFIPRLAGKMIRLHCKDEWETRYQALSERKDLLLRALAWFSRYETWVQDTVLADRALSRMKDYPRPLYYGAGSLKLGWESQLQKLVQHWGFVNSILA